MATSFYWNTVYTAITSVAVAYRKENQETTPGGHLPGGDTEMTKSENGRACIKTHCTG